jgi:PTH2 family peptidyl-tRNA hydrolase
MGKAKSQEKAKQDFKQVIVLRKDLKLSMGKAAAQACHAAVEAFRMADKKTTEAWLKKGAKKVVLGCENEKELKALHAKAKQMGLPHALISDAGLTEVPRGTFTALGIGPEEDGKINMVTGSLPLLK